MAVFVPLPNSAKACIEFNYGGVLIMICFHIKKVGFVTTDMITAASTIYNWWSTTLRPLVTSNIDFNKVTVTDVRLQNAAQVVQAGVPPDTGSRAGNVLPANVTLAITHVTAQRGRSYRGRNYFPLLLEADVVGDGVASTFVASVVAAWGTLLNALAAAGVTWTMIVASRFSNGQPRVIGVETTITSFRSDGIVDSQRRRLLGRGA